MPNRETHLRIAATLTAFLDGDPTSMPIPQIELAFAVAYWRSLHLIDAVLADPYVNVHPAHDGERFQALQHDGRIKKLYRPYRNTKDRYYESMYRGSRLTVDDFKLDVLEDAEEIRKTAERLLGATLPKD